MQTRRKIVLQTVAAGLLWVAAVAVGLWFMLNYERTAGATGAVPTAWPSGSSIPRSANQATLVLFAHPRCPCTRATMSELAELMAKTTGKLQTCVVFFTPPGASADWTESDLHASAAAIPGVKVLDDLRGTEAKRFGAETSGHALLFGRDGKLLFSGGITASRGHAGDNAGESAIASIVNGHGAPQDRSLVFGCSFNQREKLAQNAAK
jgi:hypothetical protein